MANRGRFAGRRFRLSDSVPERGERLSEDDLKGPTSNTRIWVDDVNSDGKLDILVGDSVMLVEPAKGLSDEELKAKSAEWQKEWDAALAEWNLPDADEKKRTESEKRVRDLHDRRSSFVHEEMTGFVWLYLQK